MDFYLYVVIMYCDYKIMVLFPASRLQKKKKEVSNKENESGTWQSIFDIMRRNMFMKSLRKTIAAYRLEKYLDGDFLTWTYTKNGVNEEKNSWNGTRKV